MVRNIICTITWRRFTVALLKLASTECINSCLRYCTSHCLFAVSLDITFVYRLRRVFKGPIFLKNRHFIIRERFTKLIYGIITIKTCGFWQPVKFQLVSLSWNEIIFRIFELMLPTLVQRYDKKNRFIFDLVQKGETNWNFTSCQMSCVMIVSILYIYKKPLHKII